MARSARPGAGGTPATTALTAAGVPYTVRGYEHDPSTTAYGMEAAEALGVDPARVFKTLLVDTGSALAVAIVPVDRQLDLKAVSAALGAKKVSMADPALAERSTGYVVGGISPIGQKTRHTTVVDETAQLFDTVFVSGGKRGFDVELSPADLLRATDGTFGAIAK
jgi:Cys-tRNA(Pro)/Cys-tRNA(Cys) deacylase